MSVFRFFFFFFQAEDGIRDADVTGVQTCALPISPGQTQDGLRQEASISRLLQASRYMLAVGPPRSDTVPVKPGTLSRISSISWRMDSWERLWMIRPSCSVMEQKVQPPKQPRMIFTEKRIIS